MGTVSVFQSVTIDGIMQSVGRADEDTRGSFTHGGWGDGYSDEVAMQFVGEGMVTTAGLLFGRRTYEDLLAYWLAGDAVETVAALKPQVDGALTVTT